MISALTTVFILSLMTPRSSGLGLLRTGAVSAVERFLEAQNAPCFAFLGGQGHLPGQMTFDDPSAFNNCEDVCCQFAMVTLNDLGEFTAKFRGLDKARLYVFVNLNPDERPGLDLEIPQDNFILFQRVKGFNEIYSIFAKKRGKIARKNWHWNGQAFVDDRGRQSRTLEVDLKGETLRVATALLAPFDEVWTDVQGHVVVGRGVLVS